VSAPTPTNTAGNRDAQPVEHYLTDSETDVGIATMSGTSIVVPQKITATAAPSAATVTRSPLASCLRLARDATDTSFAAQQPCRRQQSPDRADRRQEDVSL
jgi:hypothetical protein